MMEVKIIINGEEVVSRAVRNTSPNARRDELSVYECDDGTIINHRRSDGCVSLAIKVLNTVAGDE